MSIAQRGQLIRYRDSAGVAWPAVIVRVIPKKVDPEWRPVDLRFIGDSASLELVSNVERCPDGEEVPNTWSWPA